MTYINKKNELCILNDCAFDKIDELLKEHVKMAESELEERLDTLDSNMNQIFAKYDPDISWDNYKADTLAETYFSDEDYEEYQKLYEQYSDLENNAAESIKKLHKLLENALEITEFLITEYDEIIK